RTRLPYPSHAILHQQFPEKPRRLLGLLPPRESPCPVDMRERAGLRMPADEARDEEGGGYVEDKREPDHAPPRGSSTRMASVRMRRLQGRSGGRGKGQHEGRSVPAMLAWAPR